MKLLLRYIMADYIKTKNLSIRMAHFLIPIGVSVIFITYYFYSPWDSFIKAEAYFQILGIGFPFLIGLFTSMLAQQEIEAGAYQVMLISPKRNVAYFSKIILLFLFGIISVLLACGLFGFGNIYLLKQDIFVLYDYCIVAFILFLSNLFLYILHLFLSIKYNKGVSICLGIVESLLSALMLTGLGDFIWMYVPCAWGARFASFYLLLTSDKQSHDLILSQCKIGIITCFITTIIIMFLSIIWFCYWDGQKSYD